MSNYNCLTMMILRKCRANYEELTSLINSDRAEDEGSAVAEGILDRIINNKYSIEVKGRISMRKRHAFSDEGNGVNDNG